MKTPSARTGRWKPGESGNPAGRAPGSGEIAKLRATIVTSVPALVAVLVERALVGEVGAARLLLERVIPPMKATEEAAPLTLPDGTLAEQGRAVLSAVAEGRMGPQQGAALMGAIATLP